MSRENILFGIIGILLGFIVGFMFASSMSQKMQTASASLSQSLPSDHPPVGEDAGGGGNPDQVRAQVTADIEKARNEPKNFDAQVKAAELFYRIGRFDQSIEFLQKANQLKPTDYDTIVSLGMVNLQAGHNEPAEKWLNAALKIKPDDEQVKDALAKLKAK
jgi:tetratricopeptide (TPR) repeat protein